MIKYEVDKSIAGVDCLTECPYGMKLPYIDKKIKVGSNGCTCCEHHILRDIDKQIVMCKKESEIKQCTKPENKECHAKYNGDCMNAFVCKKE